MTHRDNTTNTAVVDATSFRVSYDESADVLYVTSAHWRSVYGVEDHNGIVWRFDADGTLVGVTIMDFSRRHQ